MASEHRTLAAQGKELGSDLGSLVGDWLDPFAGQAETAAVSDRAVEGEESLPFSEWCVVPVALAFIIGDMILQFMK